MIEPKKIYEGIHSILRNIVPGLIILSPILASLDNIIEKDILAILIILYLVISVISHSLLEGIGYLYLNHSWKTQCFICQWIKDGFVWLLLPSYFVYRSYLLKEIIKKDGLNDISFEEYREIQNTPKMQFLFGDHDYIHRINSFMISFDIACIGLLVLLLGVGANYFFKIAVSIKNINILICNKEQSLAVMVSILYGLLVVIRYILRKNLCKYELETFFNVKYNWSSLLKSYRSEALRYPYLQKEKE